MQVEALPILLCQFIIYNLTDFYGYCASFTSCRSGIIRNNPRGYQDDINKQLIGCMVLTRYNNKTYRIDDIAWDKNPLSSFASITGENITFVDYYRSVLNVCEHTYLYMNTYVY